MVAVLTAMAIIAWLSENRSQSTQSSAVSVGARLDHALTPKMINAMKQPRMTNCQYVGAYLNCTTF
jgi:hypothetical protein